MSTHPTIIGGAKIASQLSMPVVEITPALAEEWLKRNVSNRRLRNHKIDVYAQAMAAGDWRESREPIEFDEYGNLINGQHRLYAVIRSGATILNPVRENVSRSELPIIDTGLARQASDVLTMAGHKNATLLAAVAKCWYLWQNYPSLTMLRADSYRINNEKIEEIVNSHPDLALSAEFAKHASTTFRLVPPSALGAVHYEAVQKFGLATANDFFTKMANGYDLHPGSPILALRNILMKTQTSLSKPPTELRMAWVIHAFNKWLRGDSDVRLIKHLRSAPFPQLGAV